MVAHPQPPLWSVQAYLEMERGSPIRHEYLAGHGVDMAGGTRRHSRIGVNVTALLSDLVGAGPCQVFNSDMKVRIDARNYVYLDAAVSCHPDDTADGEADFISHPILIVEVLSDDSTARYDRGDKFTLLYKGLPSLREYVLVDARAVAVDIYRRAESRPWTEQSYGLGDVVNLESLGATALISAYYAHVAL